MKFNTALQFVTAVMICLFCGGCCKHEDRLKVKAALYEEAMRFVKTEFPRFADDRQDSLTSAVQRMVNENNPEFIIYPGGYKLKYYSIGDPFHYTPFAIQVTDEDNRLITHFAFRDEAHYLYDSIYYSVDGDSVTISSDSANTYFRTETNMQKNLNALVHTLGYEKDPDAIHNLIGMIFYHALHMKPATRHEIKGVVDHLGRVLNKDAIFRSAVDEYISLVFGNQMVYEAKEGESGFWRFTVVDNKDGTYGVKADFVGEIFFWNIYM